MKYTGSKPLVVRTYSIVTEESARNGDTSEHGFADFRGNQFPTDHDKPETYQFDLELIGEDCTPDEGETAASRAISVLRDHGATNPSSWPGFHAGIWYSAEPEQDYSSGDDTEYSYHLYGFTPEQEREIFAAISR